MCSVQFLRKFDGFEDNCTKVSKCANIVIIHVLTCLKLTHIAYSVGMYWQIMLSNSGQGPSVMTLIFILHFARNVKERTLELGKDLFSSVDTLRDRGMDCLTC